MHDLLRLSASEQAGLIRGRKVSSCELVQAHLDQIAKVNPEINAAVEVFADNAMAEARTADRTLARNGGTIGPLHGVPFSIKDSIEVAGTVCTAGTLGRAGAPKSTEDATLAVSYTHLTLPTILRV